MIKKNKTTLFTRPNRNWNYLEIVPHFFSKSKPLEYPSQYFTDPLDNLRTPWMSSILHMQTFQKAQCTSYKLFATVQEVILL